MKLGRNELCPCGSGKKYKHCCMNETTIKYSDAFDEVEQIIAMNPNLSLDELDVVMQHRIQQYNNRPLPNCCGLSPNQLKNWLYAPFEKVEGVEITSPDELSSSPVMQYLKLILDEAMQHGGRVKITAKGNLPTKLVKQASELLPTFAVSKYERQESISEFAGSNEDKFNALHYTRVIAEIAGLLYKRSGYLHVKKSVQKQYQALGLEAFYLPMLEVVVSQYNWSYFDSFPEEIDLRIFWLFMLWRIQTHSNVEKLVEELITAFPDLLQHLVPNQYMTSTERLKWIIETRFLARFLQFWGFIILDPKCYEQGKLLSRHVEIQPLLAQTFKFAIDG